MAAEVASTINFPEIPAERKMTVIAGIDTVTVYPLRRHREHSDHCGNWDGEEATTPNLGKEPLRTDLEADSEAESNSLPTPPMMSGANGIWKK